MVNIFESLEYDENLTLEEYNQITKDVFFIYFKDENDFLKYKELLRTELVNYVTHILNKDKSEKLFEKLLKTFNDSISHNYEQVIQELAIYLPKIVKTDELYMSYCINQPKDVSRYTPRDFATYYFKSIDDLLEGCFKPRLELFYKIYKYNIDKSFPATSNETFGNIVNLINDFDDLLKDPIFGIAISQWRNISAHKDFKVSKDNIVVEYGNKDNKKTQSLTHNQLKEITFWINSIYSILRLSEIIVYLIHTEEIIELDEYKNTQINLRSEASLLHIIHNLQIVGFEFHSFNEIEIVFELSLYKKANKDVKESIIHASQAFTQIAIALDGDDFQKEEFEFIQINILCDEEQILASAKVDIKTCIDYSYGKIEMKDLIRKIEFEGI